MIRTLKRRYGTALCTLMSVLLFASCSDFLEVELKGRATIPSFLRDPSGLRAGLVGAYNAVYDYYDAEFTKYPDVAGNMCLMNATTGSMVDQYNFTSAADQETGAVGHIWVNIYAAQANVNNIIQYAPDVIELDPPTASKSRRYLGEAYLLRAMCHFDQVRCYAQPYNYTASHNHLGVPVLWKTPGADENVKRKSVREVYEAVLQDLGDAAGILTDDVAQDYHYASLQAVNCMYARVYLYMEEWQKALAYAKKAIGTQQLSQGSDYLKMFRDLNYQGEAIFRLSGIDMNGSLKSFYDAVSPSCMPADTLLTLFDAGDLRLQLLRQGNASRCLKYDNDISLLASDQARRDDPFVFRLSEMFLTAAEAACNLSDYTTARPYLRAIVERAVGADKATAVMDATPDAQLLDLVRRERVKELCFEGHNFFDLTRWKQDLVREKSTTSIVKRIDYPSDYFVLPIPQRELDANLNMQPNPTVNQPRTSGTTEESSDE